jgi:hypothetical protein
MGEKLVIYNGVKVSADWPAKIEAAQVLTHDTIAGRKFARIRFGDDDPRWGQKPCLDCAVLKAIICAMFSAQPFGVAFWLSRAIAAFNFPTAL